jgi:hypothetical protein
VWIDGTQARQRVHHGFSATAAWYSDEKFLPHRQLGNLGTLHPALVMPQNRTESRSAEANSKNRYLGSQNFNPR